MGTKSLSKKTMYTSLICAYTGLLILVFGIIFILISYQESIWVRVAIFLPGLILLLIGSGLLTAKLKCPYCGFGSGGRIRHGSYHELISFRSIKEGHIVCPKCEETIEIV